MFLFQKSGYWNCGIKFVRNVNDSRFLKRSPDVIVFKKERNPCASARNYNKIKGNVKIMRKFQLKGNLGFLLNSIMKIKNRKFPKVSTLRTIFNFVILFFEVQKNFLLKFYKPKIAVC